MLLAVRSCVEHELAGLGQWKASQQTGFHALRVFLKMVDPLRLVLKSTENDPILLGLPNFVEVLLVCP